MLTRGGFSRSETWLEVSSLSAWCLQAPVTTVSPTFGLSWGLPGSCLPVEMQAPSVVPGLRALGWRSVWIPQKWPPNVPWRDHANEVILLGSQTEKLRPEGFMQWPPHAPACLRGPGGRVPFPASVGSGRRRPAGALSQGIGPSASLPLCSFCFCVRGNFPPSRLQCLPISSHTSACVCTPDLCLAASPA